MTNLCTISDATMFYKNLAFIIPIPVLLGLCKPTTRNTSTSPQMNILAPRHQLIAWINNFIFTVAFIYSFEVYWNSPQYEPNHRGWVSMQQGFTIRSQSSTLCCLLIAAHCLAVIFNMYHRDPWKRSITDNIPLTFWLIFNLASLYVVFFHQEWMWYMHLDTISSTLSTRVLVIMASAFGLSCAATSLIYRNN
jgi:hypothetical protein